MIAMYSPKANIDLVSFFALTSTYHLNIRINKPTRMAICVNRPINAKKPTRRVKLEIVCSKEAIFFASCEPFLNKVLYAYVKNQNPNTSLRPVIANIE